MVSNIITIQIILSIQKFVAKHIYECYSIHRTTRKVWFRKY